MQSSYKPYKELARAVLTNFINECKSYVEQINLDSMTEKELLECKNKLEYYLQYPISGDGIFWAECCKMNIIDFKAEIDIIVFSMYREVLERIGRSK